jgi:hypothetical protein
VTDEVARLLDPSAGPRSSACAPPTPAGAGCWIISRSLQVTAGAGHQHSSELARWDQAYPGTGETDADPGRALKDPVTAGVRAAVVAPEPELRRWFSWQCYWTDTLIDDLIRHFFTDITTTVSRGYVPRGTCRAERSNLQSEPPSPCARHSCGGRGEQCGRVVIGQAVRLGHRARNQLAAERA